MNLRGWGNGFAVAGLFLVVGLAVAQAPDGNLRYWVALGVSVTLALLAIVLLRPKKAEQDALQLAHLRSQTTDRDIAFLRAGTQAITHPKTLSKHSVALAPSGERWKAETEKEAEARAQKLITIGLMERRNPSEVETSALGKSVIAFDQAIKIQRGAKDKRGLTRR